MLFTVGISSIYEGPQTGYRDYLALDGYRLPRDGSVHYGNGKTLIRYPERNNTTGEVSDGNWKVVETDIKFSTAKGRVLIPISGSVQKVLEVVLLLVGIGIAILGFYVLLYLPVRLLLHIAKGKAFDAKTIRSLYLIAWLLIGSALVYPFLTITCYWIFSDQIPGVIDFSYYEVIMWHWEIIVAGLVILLFGRAFQKGYELQQEQDLTI